MLKTLVLENPLTVNGKIINELTYDINEITGALYADAEAARKETQGARLTITTLAEFDYALQLYMGYAAIIAVNSWCTFSDLARLKGVDVVEVATIGRNFLMKQGNSPTSSLDEPTESSQESTTPVLEILNENE